MGIQYSPFLVSFSEEKTRPDIIGKLHFTLNFVENGKRWVRTGRSSCELAERPGADPLCIHGSGRELIGIPLPTYPVVSRLSKSSN